MTSERLNGCKINVEQLTREEAMSLYNSSMNRAEEARMDAFVAEDVLLRRWGVVAIRNRRDRELDD